MSVATRPIRGAEHTFAAGYGPLLALALLVLVMALLAPSIAPQRTVVTTRITPRTSVVPLTGRPSK